MQKAIFKAICMLDCKQHAHIQTIMRCLLQQFLAYDTKAPSEHTTHLPQNIVSPSFVYTRATLAFGGYGGAFENARAVRCALCFLVDNVVVLFGEHRG